MKDQIFSLLGDLVRELTDVIKTEIFQISQIFLKKFLNFFKDQIASKSKVAFLKIWKILEACKKKALKEITVFLLETSVKRNCNGKISRCYNFVLDDIDINLFKSTNIIPPKKKIPTSACTLD